MKQYKCKFANKREPWKPGSKKTICMKPGKCPKGAWCIKPKELTSYEKLKAQNAELRAVLNGLIDSGVCGFGLELSKARAVLKKAGA